MTDPVVCRYPLFQDRVAVADFAALIASCDEKEFGSPTRSTIPLLMLLRDAPDLFDEVLAALGAATLGDASLHFEYKVDGPRGQGLPSHTDLMVRSITLQLALEAKWSEPRYEDVEKWLRKGDSPSANKVERLAGWLQLLQPHAERPLRTEDFVGAVYQMVHRAASACENPALQPRLAYVVFKPHPEGAHHHAPYADDLRHLKALLGGPSAFSFHLVEIALRPTPRFEALRSLKKSASATIEVVRGAVLAGGLFEFGPFVHQEIGAR